jgi:hypothetical protein
LPQGALKGARRFARVVRDALACAAREGWRELILSDADFHDWPLGERAVIDSLNAWARSGRSLGDAGPQLRRCAAHPCPFRDLAPTWAHIIECRRCAKGDAVGFPSVLWSSAWVMRRLDPEHCTGVCTSAPEPRVASRESLKEWLGQSSPGFPVTTLGL